MLHKNCRFYRCNRTWSGEDIEKLFKAANANAFAYKCGNGLCPWKPYLIKKMLDNMRDGKIPFYRRKLIPVRDVIKKAVKGK